MFPGKNWNRKMEMHGNMISMVPKGRETLWGRSQAQRPDLPAHKGIFLSQSSQKMGIHLAGRCQGLPYKESQADQNARH